MGVSRSRPPEGRAGIIRAQAPVRVLDRWKGEWSVFSAHRGIKWRLVKRASVVCEKESKPLSCRSLCAPEAVETGAEASSWRNMTRSTDPLARPRWSEGEEAGG